jgi:YtxH-like protein
MNLHDLTDRLSLQELAKLIQLEPRRSQPESLLGSVALFGTGALIGAAVALFLAPKSGAELRHDVADQLRSSGEKIGEAVGTASPHDA